MKINNSLIHKEDFQVENQDKNLLDCTLYHDGRHINDPLNIVIYLHTKGGCRFEGLFLL